MVSHQFIVYIDESGDEGFTFRETPKGSSDWFILSAIITSVSDDQEVRTTAHSIRQAIGLPEKATIHFADIPHERRVRTVEEIVASNVTIASVAINKRAIKQPQIFTEEPFRLYYYSARLLLERVSWHCRDFAIRNRFPSPEARIIFEHRKRLSYEKLRTYLTLLKENSKADAFHNMLTNGVNIHWPTINIEKIEAAQKHGFAGLQLADVCASGIRAALEVNRYGNTEHRYAKMLKPRVYAYNGAYSSYGMKCFPCPPEQDAPNGHWLRKHY